MRHTAGAIGKLQGDLKALESQVSSVEKREQELLVKLTSVTNKQTSLEFLQTRWQSLVIGPVTEQGFTRVDTSVASLVVAVGDVQPYADGTRVNLSVGNLSSATLSNVSGSAQYGASLPLLEWGSDEKAMAKYQAWQSSLKSKDFTVNGDLAPGTWNPVTLTLGGVKPSEFGHLELKLDAKSLILRKSK